MNTETLSKLGSTGRASVEEDNPHVFTVPSADEVKELLSDLEKRILAYDKRVISVNEVEWEEIVSKREILNSRGLSVSDRSRIHVLIAECAVMENEEVKDLHKSNG